MLKTWAAVTLSTSTLLVAAAAMAQPVQMREDVSGFVGIRFDERFPGNGIPMCDRSKRQVKGAPMCYVRGRAATDYGLNNPPDLGFDYTLSLDTRDGTPFQFTIDTPATNFDALIAVLKERYGPPTGEGTGAMASGQGPSTPVRTAAWIGPKVEIIAFVRGPGQEMATVTVSDLRRRQAAMPTKAQIKQGAAQL